MGFNSGFKRLNTNTCFNTFCWPFQTGSGENRSLLLQETQSYCGHLRRTTLTLTVTSEWEVWCLVFINSNWCSLSYFRYIWLNVVVSYVCEFINLFPTVFCSVGAVYKFVCRLVIYGDRQKDGWNQWQWSKENSSLRYKATTRSLVKNEYPLIGNVVRMTITVHRQLDFFKSLGVDTIFKVGLLSVDPKHTGRGVGTCIFVAYWLNYLSLRTTYSCFWMWHDTACPFRCEPSGDHAVPTAAVYSVWELRYTLYLNHTTNSHFHFLIIV